jgi:hypothetical protein
VTLVCTRVCSLGRAGREEGTVSQSRQAETGMLPMPWRQSSGPSSFTNWSSHSACPRARDVSQRPHGRCLSNALCRLARAGAARAGAAAAARDSRRPCPRARGGRRGGEGGGAGLGGRRPRDASEREGGVECERLEQHALQHRLGRGGRGHVRRHLVSWLDPHVVEALDTCALSGPRVRRRADTQLTRVARRPAHPPGR